MNNNFFFFFKCCSSLIIERINEDKSKPMSSSLVKMLYILHWLLLDASIECNENVNNTILKKCINIYLFFFFNLKIINNANNSVENDNKDNNKNFSIYFCQLTYPISSIQLFVFLLAPLFHTIKESEIKDHIRLQSGISIWEALWQVNFFCL